MKIFKLLKNNHCLFIFPFLLFLLSCDKSEDTLKSEKQSLVSLYLKSEGFLKIDNDSAFLYANISLSKAISSKNQLIELKSLKLIGHTLLEQKKYKEAIQYFKKALNSSIIKREMAIAADIYMHIGYCEVKLNNHLSAILNYRKALSFNSKIDAPAVFGDAAEALGDLYGRIQYHNNALHFYSESQKSFKEYNNLYRSYCVQNKLAAIHWSSNDLSKALEYYNLSLSYFSRSGYKVEEASTLIHMAKINVIQGHLERAYENASLSKNLALEASNMEILMDSHLLLGKIHLSQNSYRKSKEEFLTSLEIADILNERETIISLKSHLAIVEEKLGRYKESIAYFKEHYSELEEIRNFKKEQEVIDILTTIALNKNQKEIASLEKRNSVIEKYSSLRSEGLGNNRSFIMLLTAFVIVFILLVAVYYKRFKDKKNVSKILEDTVKERTEALNQTLRKLSFHVNNTTLAVIELDVTQRVKDWSAQSEKIFGWSSDEVKDEELRNIEIFQKDSSKEIKNVFSKIKSGKLSRKFLLLRNLHKDGSILYVEWNFSVLSGEGGEILSILCFANNVTHRELALIEAETANKELDNFIYKTSHDVKGPIARIEGLINLGLIEAKEQVSIDYFKRLNNVAATFNIVLSRLFRIHGLYYHQPEPVVLNLKNEISDLLHSLKKKNDLYDLDYEVNMSDDICCHTDKLLLYIIIQNIYENALDYRKDGLSRIIFSAEVVNINHLKLRIRDNGTCIPLEAVDRIFDMFFQNTAQSSTAGLGLYMVKKSVEKLGGTIKLLEDKSETIFEILLPKASA